MIAGFICLWAKIFCLTQRVSKAGYTVPEVNG